MCAIAAPVAALALTGRVIDPTDVESKPTSKKYGWVCLQYQRNSDTSYPTQWALRHSSGWTAFSDVDLPDRDTNARRMPAEKTYMVKFRKKPGASGNFEVPKPVTVGVIDQKVTIRYVRYE